MKGTNDMEYQIVGRGVEITPALKEYALKKISKMEKYFEKGSDVHCTITISVIKIYQIAEVSIQADGIYLRAKVNDQKDAYAAIDLVVDKLEGQIRKMKAQLERLRRQSGIAKAIALEVINGDEEPESAKDIVKRKTLSLTPMDIEEAITRMDALDHPFFIFEDSSTHNTCILYRRDDGEFGLIEAVKQFLYLTLIEILGNQYLFLFLKFLLVFFSFVSNNSFSCFPPLNNGGKYVERIN